MHFFFPEGIGGIAMTSVDSEQGTEYEAAQSAPAAG